MTDGDPGLGDLTCPILLLAVQLSLRSANLRARAQRSQLGAITAPTCLKLQASQHIGQISELKTQLSSLFSTQNPHTVSQGRNCTRLGRRFWWLSIYVLTYIRQDISTCTGRLGCLSQTPDGRFPDSFDIHLDCALHAVTGPSEHPPALHVVWSPLRRGKSSSSYDRDAARVFALRRCDMGEWVYSSAWLFGPTP